MSSDLQTEVPFSQREQCYRSLRRLLILQQLPQGQRLREPEWAKRLGVHRTALREAFARLEAEGLIERGPQTGYFVPTLTAKELLEITKLRIALETLAIEEICELERPNARQKVSERLAPLISACDEFEQFLNGGYSLGVIEADRRFHEALIDAAGSKRLSTLYQRAPLPLVHRQIQDPAAWREICADTLSDHRKIVAAIARSDRNQACLLLRKHLTKRSLIPICN